MKKFFQIAAFALVGIIAFTSATVLRDTTIFASLRTGTIPPPPTDCKGVFEVRSGEGTVTNFWILYNNALGRAVQLSDIQPGTIDAYIENNEEDLECDDVSFVIE